MCSSSEGSMKRSNYISYLKLRTAPLKTTIMKCIFMTSVDWTSLYFCMMMWENNISGPYDWRNIWWIDCFTHSSKSLFCFSLGSWKNYNVTPRSAVSFMLIKSVCTPDDLPGRLQDCGLNKNHGVWTAVSARAWKTLRVKSKTFRCQ